MITREELKIGKGAVLNWSSRLPDRHGGLIRGQIFSPIAALANLRLCLEQQGGLEPYVTAMLGDDAITLRECESAMPLTHRNAIAEALFDWTAWTMRHGLGPGIMTALKNGQKEQILEAIERDLAVDEK